MNVYEVVTERMIELLDRGVVPWRKPWVDSDCPQNLVSRRPYHGINTFLLLSRGYESPFWLTFNQAKNYGGKVKKGEKSTIVVFWKMVPKRDEEEENKDDEEGEKEDLIPLLRYYRVFNVEQVEGIDDKIPEIETYSFNSIEAAERVVSEMPVPPHIDRGAKAAYYPTRDTILLPQKDKFAVEERYYSTLFHEMVHSTGHQSRLDRPEVSHSTSFGSSDYCREELVAEMGASFLNAHAGIQTEQTEEQHAAYLQAWKQKLRDDNRLIVSAAGRAQKAANFILNKED